MNNDRVKKADGPQGELTLRLSRDVLQLNAGTLYPALMRTREERGIPIMGGASEKNRTAKSLGFDSISPAEARR